MTNIRTPYYATKRPDDYTITHKNEVLAGIRTLYQDTRQIYDFIIATE